MVPSYSLLIMIRSYMLEEEERAEKRESGRGRTEDKGGERRYIHVCV